MVENSQGAKETPVKNNRVSFELKSLLFKVFRHTLTGVIGSLRALT